MSKKGGRDLLRSVHRSLLHRYSTASAATTTTSPLMEEASERYCYRPSLRWNPQVEEYFIQAYGADHFSRISEALTRPPCYSCIRVNKLKSTSDAVIEKLSSTLQDKGQQSAISRVKRRDDDAEYNIGKNQEVINGSSTNLDSFKCEEIVLKGLEIAQNGSISKCQLPGLDYVLFVKGSGPHTINYDHDNEKPPKEIIVSRKCAEAVLRGAQVYVPGVLACSAHVEKGDAVAVSVAVEQPCEEGGWGVGITRGITLQGLETDPHFAERRGLYIGQGTAMLSRAGMFRVLEGIAVDMDERVYKLPSFNDVLAGEIFLQNLPSIIAAHVLDPQEGERILDMCAAPGGKTTAIALLMKDKGEVVAVDRSHNKVLNIQKLAVELGLKCIVTYKLDALKAVQQKTESNDAPTLSSVVQEPDTDVTLKENKDNNQATQAAYRSKAEARKNLRRLKNGPGRSNCVGGRVGKSLGFPPKSFDRVLLDAPCSALGLRPRLFSGEETIASLRSDAKYQRKMFDQAVQLVRPGGVLVYSTCTINPGENEALVRYALDTYKFLSLAPQHPKVGGPGLVGGCELSDGYREEWLRAGEEELVQRFDPSSPLDTIGFFIAKFNVGPDDT